MKQVQQTVRINIMDKVGDEKFWSPSGAKKGYSHHMYRNSPFETCNTCGNCNGANCEVCHLVTTPACLEFSIGSDTLYQWLLEKNVPEDIASEIVYSDYCGHTYKGYRLIWPTEDMLQEQYPDLYTHIYTTDKEVLEVINSYRGQFSVFAELRDTILKHYNVKDRYHGHIPNQLELYWASCNCNHKLACE